MILRIFHVAIPVYRSNTEKFPLNRVPRVMYGLDRLIHDEAQRLELKEVCKLRLQQLAAVNEPCATFYPQACRHSARLARESGTYTGALLAPILRLWTRAWPLAYLACWLAEKLNAAWRTQYPPPIINAVARAQVAWEEQLASQKDSGGTDHALKTNSVCVAARELSERIDAPEVLPNCASIEVAPRNIEARNLTLRQTARGQICRGSSDEDNSACLRFFSGQSEVEHPQELLDASDWLGQIQASLRALRFAQDPSQARAAIKAASDFSWVQRVNVNTHAGYRGPQEVEGVAVVAHADQVFIANAGRCRTFSTSPSGVRQLAVPHQRDIASEQSRVFEMNDVLGTGRASSRSLSTVSPQSWARPQVTAVPLQHLRNASVVSVTPGVVEFLGAEVWQKLLIRLAQVECNEAPKWLAEAIVAAGYPDGAALTIYRLPPAKQGDL